MEGWKVNNKTLNPLSAIPYAAWIILFVVAPIALIIFYSFFDLSGAFTLDNYKNFFTSVYFSLTINSFWYAFLITFFSLLFAYPTAYFLTNTKLKSVNSSWCCPIPTSSRKAFTGP